MEKEIEMEREAVVIGAGGAVNSVNGQTGDVVLTTSDLENTSDYQNGTEVESAISAAIAGIDIPTKTSDLTNDGATGTSTYVEATALSAETTAREQADNALQGQIDAISASSDVTDIVGTKAELNAYDTSKLGDNDIIKVLQDESENGETTYYRWSTTTQSFTLIGEEGPYYTKAATDTLLNAKADKTTTYTKTEVDTALATKQGTLTAGTDISIANDVISATNRGLPRELTSNDYNWPTANPDGVALWLLPEGLYTAPNAKVYYASADRVSPEPRLILVSDYSSTFAAITRFEGERAQLWKTTKSNGSRSGFYNYLTNYFVKDNLQGTETDCPLSANQGRVLNTRIGDLSTLTTTAKTSAVAAINELAATPGAATVSSQDWSDLWQ